jgi:hypothetical protein
MRKRAQTAQQQITDTEWRSLAPQLWDIIPHVTYDWKISSAAEAKLGTLVTYDSSRFAGMSPIERNQALRDLIAPRLASADISDLYLLSAWIIRDWGGITGRPRGDKQDPLLAWAKGLVGFAPATVEGFLVERGLERVSSWSKLLAFADSDRYAIYDTRVAVTLNIALRAVGERRQFHLPTGRNDVVARAAAALGSVKRPLGYLDYLSALRALVSERGQTFLSAETTLFAAAPHLAEKLMAKMDEYLADACSMSCEP